MEPKPVTFATLAFLPAKMIYATNTLDILTVYPQKRKGEKRVLDELLITNGIKYSLSLEI